MTHSHSIDHARSGPDYSDDFRWYLGGDALLGRLKAAVSNVFNNDSERRSLIDHHMKLYGIDLDNPGGEFSITTGTRLKYNAVQSVVETAVSRLGKNRPVAAFYTKGGTLKAMRQAKGLGLYVQGAFENGDVYTKGRSAFREATIGGTGMLQFSPILTAAGWRVGCERVPQHEVLVDKWDGRVGDPNSIYRVCLMEPQNLIEKMLHTKTWKGKRKKLEKILDGLEYGKRAGQLGPRPETPVVEVIEAWRRPSDAKSEDGMHVIAIDSQVLIEEPWTEQWFPIVKYDWTPQPNAYWGKGIAEAINGVQVTINRLLRVMDAAYRSGGRPIVMVPTQAKIRPEKVSTVSTHQFINYQGTTAPSLLTVPPIHNSFHQVLAQLKQDANDLAGISEMAAHGRKPADLESGAALRKYNEMEDARHADPALNYERFYMDCATVIVGMSRLMASEGRSPTATATHTRRNRTWVQDIDFSSLELKEGDIMMSAYPTGILPSLPAGRVATVQEWLRVGFIEKAEAFFLLEIPDLNQNLSPDIAMVEAILDDIESILDAEEPQPVLPEPYQDLALTRKLATAALMRARTLQSRVDPDEDLEIRLQLLHRYIDHVSVYEERAAMMGAAQQPAQSGPIADAPQASSLAEIQSGA